MISFTHNKGKEWLKMDKIKTEGSGKGLLWKPIIERVEHKASDGITYEFVDYWDKLRKVRVWAKSNEANVLHLSVKEITSFSSDDLKVFGVWDLLSEDDKKAFETNIAMVKSQVIDKMDHVRKHRKSSEDYIGVPREVTCSKCQKVQAMAPAQVIKRATAKGIDPHEFAKVFVCLECDPSQRGRKASGKYANMTKELKCTHEGCTFVCKQHPSMTEKAAEKKGMTFTEYVNSWKCKEHRVKKVHHFTQAKLDREASGKGKIKVEKVIGEKKHKGRASSGKYDGISGELHCTHPGCKFIQRQHASLSIKAAEVKGISLQEFFANWKCKEHRIKKSDKVKV
jgi:hypothetical protein